MIQSRFMEAAECGRHLMGVLPDGTVTGILTHDGEWYKTYMDTSPRYPRFEREYHHTPLSEALPEFAEQGPMGELKTTHVHYEGETYQEEEMVSAGFGGWRYEYERLRHFRRRVLRGDISVPAPTIFNRYGEPYIVKGYEDELDDLYWNFISSHYEYRQSHYVATT